MQNTMNCNIKLKTLFVVAAVVWLGASAPAPAAPYACDVTNDAGTVSFRLNENADNVKIISGGGAVTNDLGPGIKGLTVTNLAIGNGVIKVMVTRSSAAGYVQVSNDLYQDNGVYVNKFEHPRGVVVNKNPATPSFGRIYVSNARSAATSVGAVRDTYDGIYLINSDNTIALDTGVNPRTAGLAFSGGSETASPLRLTIGKDDNQLYICDLSDPSGGLWTTDLDVTTGVNVLDVIGDPGTSGATTHGSIYAAVVEGSLANSNLKIFTMDEDLAPIRSAWRYEINGGPLPFTGAATGLGQAMINSAVDLARGGSSNYLYATQNRSNGTDAPSIRVFTEDGTVITNSWDASRDYLNNPTAADLFRNTVAIDISPDGSMLALLRGSAIGAVTLVPLTNGVFNFAATNSFLYGGFSDSTRDLAFDAAGNIYVISSASEWLRIFSKGGATVAITGTDGTFLLSTPPVLVSVSASMATADEQGPVNGQFTLTRTGDSSVPLTVNYTIGGTATAGADYTALPGSVTFLAGATSTNLAVTVNDDATAELTETVTLTLTSGPGYGIGTIAATVSILDNETPEISFNTVATNRLLESYAPSKVTLQLARRGLRTAPLTVNLSAAGTATRSADFNCPASVTLAANAATTNIILTPVNDQNYEGDEIAAISVAADAGYNLGATNTAYALVVDDEVPRGGTLFSDDFTADTSPAWKVNVADPNDGFVEFAWDYGALAGIPPAPATTDGSTKGLRMRCGNVTPQPSAVSLSPLLGNFTGNYRLTFDLWINYNGPLPDGGAGSTQHFDAGVGTTGDTVVWYNNPSADGVWFTCSGDGADGATFGDYSAFIGLYTQNDDTGFYAAGTGPANGGLRDHANAFYTSLWGGQTAPAAQLALYPGQTGVANLGNAGMAWHSVVITKAGDTVQWQMDGITICTVTNDPVTLSTNVFVGYQDRFAVTLSDVPEMSFGLVDNVRVETYLSAPITIPRIQVVGGNIEVVFSGPAEAAAGTFKLQSSGEVAGTYGDDNSATLSTVSAGVFKATTALNGNRYYRIKF